MLWWAVIYSFIRYAKVLKAEIINRYLNIYMYLLHAELALQRFAKSSGCICFIAISSRGIG